MKAAWPLYYLLKDLAWDWRRLSMNLLGLAGVMAGYFLMSALAQAVERFENPAVGQGSNLLLVMSGVMDPMESSLDQATLAQAVTAIRQAYGDQAVLAAGPLIFRHLSLEGAIVQVYAAPVQDFVTLHHLELLQGEWPAGLDQMLMTEEVAHSLGWQVGETHRLYGNEFRLSGLARAAGNMVFSVWLDYTAGRRLFGAERGFQIGLLQLHPSLEAGAVQAALSQLPAFTGQYDFYLQDAFYRKTVSGTQDFINLTRVINGLALAMVGLGAFNLAALMLQERQHDLKLLGVLGFDPPGLRGLVLQRTLIQVFLAFLLGWGAAALLVRLYHGGEPLMLHSLPLRLEITAAAVCTGLLLSQAAGALGVGWLLRQPIGTESIQRPGAGLGMVR